MRVATVAHALEEAAAVVDAFDVREADRRLVVVGEAVEVVGDATPSPRCRPRSPG